nr:hypothetical protein GCM10020063_015240 [Dactylosporangium thailandense]
MVLELCGNPSLPPDAVWRILQTRRGALLGPHHRPTPWPVDKTIASVAWNRDVRRPRKCRWGKTSATGTDGDTDRLLGTAPGEDRRLASPYRGRCGPPGRRPSRGADWVLPPRRGRHPAVPDAHTVGMAKANTATPTRAPLRSVDTVKIPVAVTAALPHEIGRWPTVTDLREATPRVTTTWRQLLLASVEVGRPLPVHHLLQSPFARAETAVRVNSLTALLARTVDAAGTPVAVLSEWALAGADSSELGAASYRLGMAATHWLWRHQLGMSGTDHVSLKFPAAHPIRGRGGLQADLWGLQTWPGPPMPWLIEAKGTAGRRVRDETRKKAVQQLTAAMRRGLGGPHGQLLVCTAADPLVHIVADMTAANLPASAKDPSLWPLSEAAEPTPQRRGDAFLRRLLVGAMLLQSPTRGVSLPVGAARVAHIPDADVAVGLLHTPADVVMRQLRLVRRWLTRAGARTMESDETQQRALVEHVIAHEREFGYQELEALAGPDWEGLSERIGGMALFDEGGDGWESGAALNDAGIVLTLGPSWQEPGFGDLQTLS